MSKITGPRYCQQCGRYEGTGKTADTIIVLVRVKKRLLCQNHRPKPKKTEQPPDAAQLSFEAEKG